MKDMLGSGLGLIPVWNVSVASNQHHGELMMMNFSRCSATAVMLVALSGAALAQMKPEDAISFRQAGYKYMSWSMSRIKANVEGQYSKDDVIQAANVIQAIANSGMGRLYLPGTNKGKGFHETQVKAELFTDKEGIGRIGKAFNEAANEMARIAVTGDQAAVKTQYGKLAESCKGCHEKYRQLD